MRILDGRMNCMASPLRRPDGSNFRFTGKANMGSSRFSLPCFECICELWDFPGLSISSRSKGLSGYNLATTISNTKAFKPVFLLKLHIALCWTPHTSSDIIPQHITVLASLGILLHLENTCFTSKNMLHIEKYASHRKHMLHSAQYSPRLGQGSSHMITLQTLHLSHRPRRKHPIGRLKITSDYAHN